MLPTRRNNAFGRIPIFFKIWFGFVALVMVAILGFGAWAVTGLVNAGPDAIGRAAGQAMRAYNETAR
jgi:hypothetical protein